MCASAASLGFNDPTSRRNFRLSSSYRRWSAALTLGCTRSNACSKCSNVTSGGAGGAGKFAPPAPAPVPSLRARSRSASAAVAAARFPLSAATHASRTRAAKSAPENPAHRVDTPMDPTSTSALSGVLRVSVFKMAARPSGGGSGT